MSGEGASTMKAIYRFWWPVVLAVVVSGSSGCSGARPMSAGKGTKYEYRYGMVQPTKNSDLLYQDDSLIVQFKFDDAAVRFQLQNLAQTDLRIDWGKMALGINNRFFAIRHSGTLYGDTAALTLSEALPSFGYLRDLVIPRTNVFFDGERWVEVDLFPTTDGNSAALRDSILRSPGQTVTLVFPVQFGGIEKRYQFDFEIASVNRIPWKDYQPVKRIPPPPNPKRSPAVLDQVTTAVIVVGVLGFTAYLISVKKNPPTE